MTDTIKHMWDQVEQARADGTFSSPARSATMTRDTDERKLLKTLQDSVDDPMWADHVEMPKRILRIVIERLRAPAGHAEREALEECASRCRYDGDLFHDQGNIVRRDASWRAADMAAAALSNAPAPSEGVRELPRELSDAIKRLCDYAEDIDCTERPAIGDYDVTSDIRSVCKALVYAVKFPGLDFDLSALRIPDDVAESAIDDLPIVTVREGFERRTGHASPTAPADKEDQGPDTLGERP